jgi:hypothetical protein
MVFHNSSEVSAHMTNARDRSSVISYAVWFRLSPPHSDKIQRLFSELRRVTAKTWTLSTDLRPPTKFGDWFRVGDDFYLLHTQEHWSEGDICGHIRHFNLIGPAEEVMAVRIDRPEHWGLPAHGLLDPTAQSEMYEWQEQAAHWYYVRTPDVTRLKSS